MPPKKLLPDDNTLRRMIASGMTHKQIAETFAVARSTVSARLHRIGETQQLRYLETIPWKRIKTEHNQSYPLMMLRLHARTLRGDTLTRDQNDRLRSWKKRLLDHDAVVVYLPDSSDGFYYVKRDLKADRSLLIRV
jgi:uncharacterized protein YbcC (UPF0753/DUF2309 family)